MALDPGAGYNWGAGTGDGGGSSSSGGGGWGAAAVAALPALMQGIQGIGQARKARRLNLKDFNYIPPSLQANKSLAEQQAYSRRAPGAAEAGENIRRNLATTLSAGSRMFGGDPNKMATLVGGASAKADDAAKQVAVMGQQFSENAFNRLQQTNSQIGGQERQNYNDFWKTKSALLYASDQNIFNSINNLSSTAIAKMSDKKGGLNPQFQNPYIGGGYNAYPPNYNPYQYAPKLPNPYQ